jgi:hypothetical protein
MRSVVTWLLTRSPISCSAALLWNGLGSPEAAMLNIVELKQQPTASKTRASEKKIFGIASYLSAPLEKKKNLTIFILQNYSHSFSFAVKFQ